MKRLYFAVLLSLAAGGAYAAQISSTQALATASKYVETAGITGRLHLLKSQSLKQTDAPFYVFNSTDGNGFVIVSGDDELTEIVGYSNTGSFSAENMPSNLKAYLDNYADYVVRVQSGEATPQKVILPKATTVVEPLLTCRWNQTEPFNLLCPKDPNYDNALSATGCVATAMAQVMYYWKWPITPQDYTISYRDSGTGSRISVNFGESTYDWDNMIDRYTRYQDSGEIVKMYTDEQANAVAKLMYDCGVAVNMSYSAAASGSVDSHPLSAMSRFGYKAQMYYRAAYTQTDFLNIIKNELDNSRPLLYAGSGTSGGHEFVADGYDSNNFLHINWGWGGVSDGFFDINLMNPSALGTGGGAGGFVDGQSIITLEKDPTMTGSMGNFPLLMDVYYYNMGYDVSLTPQQTEITIGDKLQVKVNGIVNASYMHDFDGHLSIGIYDEDFNLVAVAPEKTLRLPAAQIFSNGATYEFCEELKSLSDGYYTVWPVSRDSGCDDWIRVAMNGLDMVIMTIENDKISFGASETEFHLAEAVTCGQEEILPGNRVVFNVKIKNPSVYAFEGKLKCSLYDTTGKKIISVNKSTKLAASSTTEVQVYMQMLKSSVKAGETYTFVPESFNDGTNDIPIVSEFDPYTFTVGDSSVGSLTANGNVTVYPNPTEGQIRLSADAQVKAVEAYAADGRLVARTENADNIDLSACTPGVYFVKVTTVDGDSMHRIIKK